MPRPALLQHRRAAALLDARCMVLFRRNDFGLQLGLSATTGRYRPTYKLATAANSCYTAAAVSARGL